MCVSLIIEKPNNLITQKTHYGAVLPPSQMVFFILGPIAALSNHRFDDTLLHFFAPCPWYVFKFAKVDDSQKS